LVDIIKELMSFAEDAEEGVLALRKEDVLPAVMVLFLRSENIIGRRGIFTGIERGSSY